MHHRLMKIVKFKNTESIDVVEKKCGTRMENDRCYTFWKNFNCSNNYWIHSLICMYGAYPVKWMNHSDECAERKSDCTQWIMVLNAIHREAETSFDHNEILIHICAGISIFRFVNSICNLCVSLFYERGMSFSAHFSLCSYPVMAVNSFWSFIGCAINFMVDLLIFRNNSNLLHGYHYYSSKADIHYRNRNGNGCSNGNNSCVQLNRFKTNGKATKSKVFRAHAVNVWPMGMQKKNECHK